MSIDRVLRCNLTPEQYAAAVDPAREVLCLACAGSGKSRTLAYRISRLLADGENPEGIVAFTFTEKAAESIKRRVSEALGAAGIDPTVIGAMYIGTIHAYCQRILGDIDATFRQFDVLDENRLKLYLISRSYDLGIYGLRHRARGNSYFDAIRQVSDAWKTANDELLDFDTIADEDEEIGNLLSDLSDRLRSDQYIDFSLMIRNVVEAIQDGVPGINVALGSLRHLMVDEYQDVNPSQEQLIRLLHLRSDTLFVVGDDDQAIYAWRGADVANIIDFPLRYDNSSVHTLAQNFRSTGPIVDSSDAFAASMLGPGRIAKSPNAVANRLPQDVSVLWFPDRPSEAEWVANRISDLLGTSYDDDGTARGLTPADFAVLMRSTRVKEQDESPRHRAFTDALTNAGIPYSLEAGGGPFERPQTAVLRSTFELLRNDSLTRPDLQQHFVSNVLPAFPNARFNALVRVMSDWHRRIHRPSGSTRIRLYPQQLIYDLLESFDLAHTPLNDETMRDIGLFSRMIMDVETVYLSVDSKGRFSEVLNFLANAADTGYDVSTDDLIQRPDTVTVATVHKMKGLEFPCVFIVDVEARRFPGDRRNYRGWLPEGVMAAALDRGAYRSTEEGEIRLFYTAATRAERYLYVSGSARLPQARRDRRESVFSLRMKEHPEVGEDPHALPEGLAPDQPRRRVEDADYPTSFSEVRYYLQCPRSYQLRERFGFNPIIPEMFGFGRTVHTAIQKLHEIYPSSPPCGGDVEPVVADTFHLKHVPPSRDPVARPGAFENAKRRAIEIAQKYVVDFGSDFERERQVEAFFEIPASNCVITGAIDLLLHEDAEGNIVQAEIIDFKAVEGRDEPSENNRLEWTELAVQVQLYARAADQVLGQSARTGSVHLLKDGKRVDIPITDDAVQAALANIEWAVDGILASDFPMRPHPGKCSECDFKSICPQIAESFRSSASVPPEVHLPGGIKHVAAFSAYEAH